MKKGIWIVIGVMILLSALVSGFIFIQPSAEDILVDTLETLETVNDAHAVIELHVDSPEKDGAVTFEVWGRHSEDGPVAFRLEVLEASEDKAAGGVIVSDGETLWAYSPAQGKVLVGTAEEARAMLKERMAEKEFEMGEYKSEDFKDREHPETAEEAVQVLLERFTAERMGFEQVAEQNAHRLKLSPIPEQMPTEFMAVGGYLNLWIDERRNIPLAVEYTGGSMGDFSAKVTQIEINTGVAEALFIFEIPDDVQVMSFADLQPQSLSLEEATDSAGFNLLTPAEMPDGATLVDVMDVRGAIVQRYALTEGGSFTIAQGASDSAPTPGVDQQPVEVRGVTGALFAAEDGQRVLLTWSEGDLFYYIAGDLTADQALAIAESLK